MYTDKIEEFHKIIEELSVDINVKNIIEEVSTRMNEDEILKVRYVDFLEENKKINQSIINDLTEDAKNSAMIVGMAKGEEKGRLKQQKEIVLNMYDKNLSINKISEYTNLSIDEINTIINNKN